MARTIEQIYDSILVAKRSRSELNVLSSPSASAIWRLWAYITAVAFYTVETYFDLFKAEVNDTISRKEYGTPVWYAERAREFQLGDQLAVIGGRTAYPVIDAAKRIVTRVAYKEAPGALTLKVAKGGENAEALSATELQQFKGYIERIKPAGVIVNAVSLNADRLQVVGTVYFNGILSPAVVKTAVEAALKAYMKNLDFDGQIYRNRLIDAVQRVEGVIDFDLSALNLIQGASTEAVIRVAETASGYVVEDSGVGVTFSDGINYVPNV
jgi:hypothetical protein